MSDEENPSKLKDLGNEFFKSKNFSEAINFYKKAQEKSNDNKLNAILWTNLAQCYLI